MTMFTGGAPRPELDEVVVDMHRPDGSSDGITQDSAALLFRKRHAGQLLYDHDVGSWFVWTGNRWQRERTGLAFDFARTLARDLSKAEAGKARGMLQKTSFASGVERFAQRDRPFAITSDGWDLDPMLLGTPGGTVDLTTGQLRQARPDDRITKLTTVAPAPRADCPRWLAFLDQTCGGNAELVQFLQQFAGYGLTGDVSEHALVFGYGSGGNGKSVFVNTITGVLGDYAVTAAMDTFVASHGDRHPTDLAMLRGARLVTASETEEGRAWAEARIKEITGGDRITARFMRQDFFTFQPSFKLLVVGNHRPTLRTVDDAARRRFNIVPFTHKPAAPDPDLGKKLQAEWPGILRWMIDGCLDWRRSGLVRPQSVLEETRDYFAGQDLVGQFIDEDCDTDDLGAASHRSAPAGELFSAFVTYAKASGEIAGSQKAFSDALHRRGFARHKGAKGMRQFRGIRPASPQSHFD